MGMYRTMNALLLLLLLISCGTNDKGEDAVVVNFSGRSSLAAPDLFSVSFVKLETCDSCLLGGVSQCSEVGGHYILLDNVVAKALYVFDKNGRFVQQVGANGNGPGEYVNPFTYTINENQKSLSVIDIGQEKMIVYSLEDFHFLYERELPFYSDSMEQLSDKKYVWYNKVASNVSDYYAFITNEKFEIEKGFLPIDFNSGYSLGSNKKIYRQGDEVSLYTPFDATLYRIQNDSLYSAYEFKFGNKVLPPLDFLKEKSANDNNYIPALLESPYVAFYHVYETEKALCVPYYADKTMYFGFYDKVNGISYNFSQDEIQSELQVGAFSSPIGVCDNGAFVSLLRPGLLLQLQSQGYKLGGQLMQLLKESTEDDNPILLLYAMKE